MGGRLTFPGGGWYHASKHAVEALSDALRFEVQGFGIDVVVIEPGLIRTDFAETAVGIDRAGGRPVRAGSTRPSARRRPASTRASSAAVLGGGPDTVAQAIETGGVGEAAAHALPGDAVGEAHPDAAAPPARPGLGRTRRPHLPEAVAAREALGEHADEQRRGQPDDVQVVALDLARRGRRRGPGSRSRRRVPPTRRGSCGARARAASAPGR